ncbi:MAG: hypothetical protein ACTHWZ_08400 [Peptoniphilaceae bacterium]
MKYRVLIIDDSIGAIEISRNIKNKYDLKATVNIDNLNFPLSIRKSIIEQRSRRLQESGKLLDLLIVSNPAIALNIDKNKNYPIIDGLETFKSMIEDSSDTLVLVNNYFKNYLEKSYKNIKVINCQILTNQINDFSMSKYIFENILKSYIEDYKKIFILDSSLYIIRDYINKLYKERQIFFLNDMIFKELEEVNIPEKGKKKTVEKINVTGYRRGLYLSLEDLYKDSFINIKQFKL